MESDRTIREALRFSKILAKERDNTYEELGKVVYSDPHYDSENENFVLTKSTKDEATMKKMIQASCRAVWAARPPLPTQ